MEIKEINHANLSDHEELASSDEAENIGRTCCRGLMAYDMFESKGAIVWTTMNAETDNAGEEIGFLQASDEYAAAELIEEHDAVVRSEGIAYSFLEEKDMPEGIRSALESAGFRVVNTESRDICTDVGSLDGIKVPRTRLPDYVMSIGRLTEIELWNGLTLCLYDGRKGLVEDLDQMTEEWFDPDISSCIKADGKVEGMLLVHRSPSGTLMPVLFYCRGRDQNKNLMYMLRFSINAARKKYDADTKVVLRRHDDATTNLISYLFPDAKGESVYRGERRLDTV